MRKFELYVMTSGERDRKPIVVEGFANAEKKAKSLLAEVYDDYPCEDTYVECVKKGESLDFDHYAMQKDIFGDVYWKTVVMGDWCPLYLRLLNDVEEYETEVWRNEPDLHVSDLSEEDLVKLYNQVAIGSCYLSDYTNNFFIDENEVSDVCEGYEIWLEQNGEKDTEESFLFYMMNY